MIPITNVIYTNKFNGSYSECNNPSEYDRLNSRHKKILLSWINEKLVPHKIQSYNPGISSYGLKHLFEKSGKGFYITNGTFKKAMLIAGFVPKNKECMNWTFKISQKVRAV